MSNEETYTLLVKQGNRLDNWINFLFGFVGFLLGMWVGAYSMIWWLTSLVTSVELGA